MRIFKNSKCRVITFLLLGTTLLLITYTTGWGKARARIYLEKSAMAEEKYVKLGEIAHFEGDDELIQKLKEIKIVPSPRPGNSRTINIDYIRVRLYQNGINQRKVSFEGGQEVRITSRSRCIKGEELVKLTREKIFSLFKERGIEAKVEVKRVPSLLTIPSGDMKVKVEIPSPFHLRNSVVIPLKIYIDEEVYQTIPLLLKIKAFKEVLVTSRRITPDHIFEEEDLRREIREITNLSGEPVINLSDVLGKRALKAISACTIIEEGVIGPPLLVKKGDLITILKEEENVKVLAQGKALEKGEGGSSITVLNIDSQKKLQGRVIGPRMVRVD